MNDTEKPLVYACSGRSGVAQLASDIAVVMDREGHADMSCIVGVGGDVKSLVDIAKSGRKICAIDGCPQSCVKHTLSRHGVTPKWHIELTRWGIKTSNRKSCSIQDHYEALRGVYSELGIIAKEG